MLTFKIDAKKTSPEVYIDKSKSVIEIKGNSTLKNTSWFYSNILKWTLAFNADISEQFIINIRLKKINDSSSKWLLLIFTKLAKLLPNKKITINWYYSQDGSSVQISGERLKLNSEIPVNLIAA